MFFLFILILFWGFNVGDSIKNESICIENSIQSGIVHWIEIHNKSISTWDVDDVNFCTNKVFFEQIRLLEFQYLLPMDNFNCSTMCKKSLLVFFDKPFAANPKTFDKVIGSKSCRMRFRKIIMLKWLVTFSIKFVEFLKINQIKYQLLTKFERMLHEYEQFLLHFSSEFPITIKIKDAYLKNIIISMRTSSDSRPIECLICRFIHTYVAIN